MGEGDTRLWAKPIAAHTARALVRRDSGNPEVSAGDTAEITAVLDDLLAAAEPNTVLASGAMTPLLDRHFRFERLVRSGGGAGGPGVAHRVLGRRVSGDPDGAGLIPFVGREREMDMLLDLVARAEAGRGQMVGIVGEPGIGKSRLLRELRRRLGGRGVTVREGRCLPGGRATVASTVAEILRQDYGIDEGADEATIARKVREGVAGMGLSPEEWAPSLLLLLGVREGTGGLLALPAEARRTRVFSALRLLVVSERFRAMPFLARASIVLGDLDPPFAVDLCCYTPEEFRRKRGKLGIVGIALEEGVVLSARAPGLGAGRRRAGTTQCAVREQGRPAPDGAACSPSRVPFRLAEDVGAGEAVTNGAGPGRRDDRRARSAGSRARHLSPCQP